MNYRIIRLIANYEWKLVERDWLFRLFYVFLVIFLCIFLFFLSEREDRLPYLIPASGALLGNVLFSILLIFIAMAKNRQSKVQETRELLEVRSVSNYEWFCGILLGMLYPVLKLNLLFFIGLAICHACFGNAPLRLDYYLFYFLTLNVPTLIFMAGFSLSVVRLIRIHVLVFLVLVGWIYFSFAFLGTLDNGRFNVWGGVLPYAISEITGLGFPKIYFTHRAWILCAGLGFLCLLLPFNRRLDNPSKIRLYSFGVGGFLLLGAFLLGQEYSNMFARADQRRELYAATFARYGNHLKAHAEKNEISYMQKGNRFSATSRMLLENKNSQGLKEILLYLNPGLEISRIEQDGRQLPFTRDAQVVRVQKQLRVGEQVSLKVEYEGEIDEEICCSNMKQKARWGFYKNDVFSVNGILGGRYAFLSEDYTLLLPEALWYPMCVFSDDREIRPEKDFTRYTLHVQGGEDLMIISQGRAKRERGMTTFIPASHLSGLALLMGKFKEQAMEVDSMYWASYLQKAQFPYVEDVMGCIRDIREKIEMVMKEDYPFSQLLAVETPIYFPVKKTIYSLQPEIILLEEQLNSFYTSYARLDSNLSKTLQAFLVDVDHYKFPDYHSAYLYGMIPGKFVGMDLLLMNILKQKYFEAKDLKEFEHRTLQDVLVHETNYKQTPLLHAKTQQLRAYLSSLVGYDSLMVFVRSFYERYRLQSVHIQDFFQEFQNFSGKDIVPFVEELYGELRLPDLLIQDVVVSPLHTDDNSEKYLYSFQVYNRGEVDGSVSYMRHSRDGKKSFIGQGYYMIDEMQSFVLKPGEGKHIKLIGGAPSSKATRAVHDVFVVLNGSRRYIERHSFTCEPDAEKVCDDAGVYPIDSTTFFDQWGIRVHNTDPGFRLITSEKASNRLADLKKVSAWKPSLNRWSLSDFSRSEEIYFKIAGTGDFKAEWAVQLPQDGMYEIWVEIRAIGVRDGKVEYTNDRREMEYYYTVETLQGNMEVVVKPDLNSDTRSRWVSLGKFSLKAGTSRVTLDDRGTKSSLQDRFFTYKQLVTASTVKWVKVK